MTDLNATVDVIGVNLKVEGKDAGFLSAEVSNDVDLVAMLAMPPNQPGHSSVLLDVDMLLDTIEKFDGKISAKTIIEGAYAVADQFWDLGIFECGECG